MKAHEALHLILTIDQKWDDIDAIPGFLDVIDCIC